jgi:fumarate hydratase class II
VAGGRGDGLASSLARKADLFASVLKVGRTHLQDAVPITLARSSAAMPAASIARPATSSVL